MFYLFQLKPDNFFLLKGLSNLFPLSSQTDHFIVDITNCYYWYHFYTFPLDVLVRKTFYQNGSHHFRLEEPNGENFLSIPSGNLDNG